ncbi:hypothetical protein MKX03_032632 [Papaver bracteatum]|nr:hypothetical protein MKX03_032632 [Papaver bracteatum]
MGKSGPGVMDSDQRYEFLLNHGRSNKEFGGGSYMRIVGGWRPAKVILTAETLETIAIYGVASNLMTYLTGPLHQSTATAAININVWSAVVWVLPLVGAFVADTYLGRFRKIKISSFIYLVVIASVIFTRGTYLYRFSPIEDKENPLSRVLKVYMAAAKNWRSNPSAVDELLLSNDEIRGGGGHQLR